MRSSSNGTWILTDPIFELANGSVFKVGRTLFEANILKGEVE